MTKRLSLIIASVFLLSGCQSLQFNFTDEDNHASVNDQAAENVEQDGQATNEEEIDDNQIENDFTLPSEFFNQVTETDGKKVIQNYENTLALVNKEYYLPDTYAPSDLMRANVNYSFGDEQVEKALLRSEAASALEQMFQAAESEGIELYAVSGYRSYERQQVVFNAEVAVNGQEAAAAAVAVPGSSEHQTGLAMDISARSVSLELTQDFEPTVEGQWLAENAHKYGFILRYPKGKEEITGYKFEPWHFRYVGEEYAQVIYENDLTLEEFFNIVKEI
ncbi:MAG: D-alanyl-D-alanine carboxypeptidase family protein [Bacillus sp. (in: firmicutes)]